MLGTVVLRHERLWAQGQGSQGLEEKKEKKSGIWNMAKERGKSHKRINQVEG